MQDISSQLSEIIKDKQCSSLLAFILMDKGEMSDDKSELSAVPIHDDRGNA